MVLIMEERIEAILMSGERSFRVIAADFNNQHPERLPISHNAVRCLIYKFRETGTVADSLSRQQHFLDGHSVPCQPQSQFLGISKLTTWQCCVKLEVFLGTCCLNLHLWLRNFILQTSKWPKFSPPWSKSKCIVTFEINATSNLFKVMNLAEKADVIWYITRPPFY